MPASQRGLFQPWLAVATFNVLSASCSHRLEQIVTELQSKYVAVGLQGTRRAAAQNTPYSTRRIGKMYCIESGYGPRANKHAGVAICLDSTRVQVEDIVHIAYPLDPALAGRAVAVRVKQKSMLTCVSFPHTYHRRLPTRVGV